MLQWIYRNAKIEIFSKKTGINDYLYRK
jgi:hypothetical protein